MSSTLAHGPDDQWSPVPSEEEKAYAEALFAADRAAVEASGFVPEEWDEVPVGAPEYVLLTDAELLASGSSTPGAADLLLLDSIDPAGLDDPRSVLRYLQIAEGLAGFTDALKARARVALAGCEASPVLMEELHLEHELAVATRSSRYMAATSIERARTLVTTFPAFLEALASGQVSDAHCRTLVEGTRHTTDADALATIGRVLLPKAKRLAPGPFEREVAKAVADHDPDAAARVRKARAQRSIWTRPLADGMSFLGMIHDTPTIMAIKKTLDGDADALRKVRKVPVVQRTPEEEARLAGMRAWVEAEVAAQKAAEAERARKRAELEAEKARLQAERDAAARAAGDGETDQTTEAALDDVATGAVDTDVTAIAEKSVAVDDVVTNETDQTTETVEPLADAELTVVAPRPEVLDVLEPGMDELIGACRADALAARILGRMDETGAIDWTPDPGNVQVQLVIDLDTLRGEVGRACLLDGQPVPADIGRELAGYATAFRRMVTDPVTGHLLDYGRSTYLPAPLRTYVMARDGDCRAPGCHSLHPSNAQMDHAVVFDTGPSSTTNTGGACLPTHQLKTAGYATIENSAADGSCDWVTAWGQRVHIPPRPYLHDPADHPPSPPPDDDPPPF